MVAHALPRQIALFQETAFVTGGPSSWANDSTPFYAIEPDVSGVAQVSLENENIRPRTRAKHQNILGLKNCEFSFSAYMHGKPSNAAEGAAATAFHLSTLLKSALGGADLGYGIGIADAGANPDEIEVDSDPGFAVGDFIFCHDTSATSGQFYRIVSIAAGPPVVLTLDRDLHFTADAGGADRAYAVIDCYIHQAAAAQHDHANHTTMQFQVQGEGTEDVWILKGVKPQLSIEGIAAGEPTKISCGCMVTTFDHETASKATFAAAPAGEAGNVPGVADTTLFLMATHGDPLASVAALGSISVEPGVGYDRVMGPNGYEGVHGHVDNLNDTTLEVMVPFDDDYATEYRAQTEKHALIQVGTTVGAWGVYFPQLEYAQEPARNDEGALTGSTLSFRGRENQDSIGALTGDNAEKFRSPFHILIVA